MAELTAPLSEASEAMMPNLRSAPSAISAQPQCLCAGASSAFFRGLQSRGRRRANIRMTDRSVMQVIPRAFSHLNDNMSEVARVWQAERSAVVQGPRSVMASNEAWTRPEHLVLGRLVRKRRLRRTSPGAAPFRGPSARARAGPCRTHLQATAGRSDFPVWSKPG